MDKKKDHKQDEYDFYREVMKKKPLDKRKIAISMAGSRCCAVRCDCGFCICKGGALF